MLRLRGEVHFVLLTAPLSMTSLLQVVGQFTGVFYSMRPAQLRSFTPYAAKLGTERVRGSEQGVAGKFEAGDGTGCRIAMTVAAGVFDDHGDVTEIGALAHGGFDADFHGDADDGEGEDAAIAQCHIQRRAFECRHAELVEYGFAGLRIHFWNQVESGRVAQKPGFDLFWRFHSLPGHRHAELRYAHQFLWE